MAKDFDVPVLPDNKKFYFTYKNVSANYVSTENLKEVVDDIGQFISVELLKATVGDITLAKKFWGVHGEDIISFLNNIEIIQNV